MTAEELLQLADQLERIGRERAELVYGPCEGHDGMDCHAAAAFTAWSRAAKRVREYADLLPDTATEWQWGVKLHDGSILPLIHGDTETRARAIQASSLRGAEVLRREVGPWTEVQPR